MLISRRRLCTWFVGCFAGLPFVKLKAQPSGMETIAELIIRIERDTNALLDEIARLHPAAIQVSCGTNSRHTDWEVDAHTYTDDPPRTRNLGKDPGCGIPIHAVTDRRLCFMAWRNPRSESGDWREDQRRFWARGENGVTDADA